MTLSSIRSFTLELDGPADAAFTGGEVVSGQVVLELRRDTRVHSMKVQGRGVATAHWLENRGMNSVYNDYTSKITYFRKRQHLIRVAAVCKMKPPGPNVLHGNPGEKSTPARPDTSAR